MSKEYGFDFELVQYKWPRWLHQQTEKQRTIWGYKILFLDVLFPLDVKKIIFVDADAVGATLTNETIISIISPFPLPDRSSRHERPQRIRIKRRAIRLHTFL